MARRWLGRGPRLVVLTRGSEGAWGWTATAEVEMAVVPTELVDTVGAGDSYQAALLAGLAETGRLDPAALAALTPASLAQLLAFAGTAAAITCSRRGADLPRRKSCRRCQKLTRTARPTPPPVIPAKAEIQGHRLRSLTLALDPRFRREDGRER